MIQRSIFVLFCCGILFSLNRCEKDDICLDDNLNTPNIIILFKDIENPELRKTPDKLTIRAIGNEKPLGSNLGDSIVLPLFIHKEYTQFEFVLNTGDETLENIDTLQINYQRKDQYLNSACGYRSTFILNNPPAFVLQSGNDWMKGFTIKKDSITDETTAHLVILH